MSNVDTGAHGEALTPYPEHRAALDLGHHETQGGKDLQEALGLLESKSPGGNQGIMETAASEVKT